jgi:hypothetical protein
MTLLSRTELEELVTREEEWCVSIFMPTHRAGAEIQQDPIKLKNLLSKAEEKLIQAGMRRPDAAALLEPAYDLVPQHNFWEHQSDGLALFVSPSLIRAYRLPLNLKDLVVLANRFHLKPLLPLLTADGRFYVLALSQNEIRLLQGTPYSIGELDLDHIPDSLAEALKWDDPERRLQWHTGTRVEVGGQRAVFHGHGVATADDPKDRILRYFHRIDEGISEIIAGDTAPLVLAGVDYLIPIYQEANSYPHLMEEHVPGNPEEMSGQELHQQAWSIMQPHFQQDLEEAKDRYLHLSGSGNEAASDKIEEIVPAARHGRVEFLFVQRDREEWGSFDAETNAVHRHEEPQPTDEDLLDLAAVQTFLNSGTVYVLDPSQLPDEAPLAAVFRY